MVNGVLAATVSKFLGKLNLAEGILSTEGISPMGTGLQEPAWTCLPLVMVLPTQKPIKSFGLVRESASPSACPLPLMVWMTEGSNVRLVEGLPVSVLAGGAALEEVETGGGDAVELVRMLLVLVPLTGLLVGLTSIVLVLVFPPLVFVLTLLVFVLMLLVFVLMLLVLVFTSLVLVFTSLVLVLMLLVLVFTFLVLVLTLLVLVLTLLVLVFTSLVLVLTFLVLVLPFLTELVIVLILLELVLVFILSEDVWVFLITLVLVLVFTLLDVLVFLTILLVDPLSKLTLPGREVTTGREEVLTLLDDRELEEGLPPFMVCVTVIVTVRTL
jgi:hypothetical protein